MKKIVVVREKDHRDSWDEFFSTNEKNKAIDAAISEWRHLSLSEQANSSIIIGFCDSDEDGCYGDIDVIAEWGYPHSLQEFDAINATIEKLQQHAKHGSVDTKITTTSNLIASWEAASEHVGKTWLGLTPNEKKNTVIEVFYRKENELVARIKSSSLWVHETIRNEVLNFIEQEIRRLNSNDWQYAIFTDDEAERLYKFFSNAELSKVECEATEEYVDIFVDLLSHLFDNNDK